MNHFMLVRKTLRDWRAATVGIGVTVFLMALMDTLIYPQYRDQLKDFQIPEFMRGFLGEAGEFTSPAGFFHTEFFSWIPLLLITLAIIAGTGAFAGEEGAGTLDLLLAQPVPRWRLVLEKAAGITLAILLAALAGLPGFLLGTLAVDIDLGVGRLALAVLNMLPLTLLFLALSLWASAALPTRGAAAAVGIGAVVATYVLNMLGASVDLLETPRKLSPFYWSDASRILLYGFHDWLRVGTMLGMATALLALAVWSFARRDIATGAREWRMLARLPRLIPHRRPPIHAPSAPRPT